MKKNILIIFWFIFITLGLHAQNSLSIPTVYAGIDREATIEIHLSNAQPVAAFEFVLEIPADVEINEKKAVLTYRSNEHILSQGKRKGNKIKFIAFTMNGNGFKGKEGAILKIPIKTSSKYKEGETYPLKLSDVILSSTDAKEIGSEHKDGELKIVEVDSPDLTVTSIINTEKNISPEGKLSLSWEVKNIGTAVAQGGWREEVSLISTKTNFRRLLSSNTSYTGDLKPDESLSRSITLNLPRILGLDGEVFVEINLIPASTVKELPSQKSNNALIGNESLFLEKKLYFTLSRNSINENEISDLIRATISQSGDFTKDYSYTINSSPQEQLELPSNVKIAKNTSSTTFYVKPIDNQIINGDRIVTISVEGNNYKKVESQITIIDNEIPALKVSSSKMSVTDDDEFIVTVESEIAYKSDIVLNISADQANRWIVPAEVVLPKGNKTVSFTVKVKNNRKPESTVTGFITVRGESIIGGKVAIEIKSSNVPQFKLEIYPDTISEGDGAYAGTAIITRLDKNEISATISISTDVKDALILPKTINFPAGVKSKKFNIGVVDNDIVEPTREVKIKAVVYIAECSCEAKISESEQIKSVFILDNDGQSLKVSAEPTTVKAGVVNATKLTISRNVTDLSEALTVNLKSDVPTVVDMPEQIVIPMGQKSVTVNINTKIDPNLKGDQTIRIQASAKNYTDGFVWILVSDQKNPDADITGLEIDTDYKGGGVAKINTIIKNQGFALLPKNMKVDYYLSKNKSVLGAVLLGNKFTNEKIEVGSSITFSSEITLPESAGKYYLIVVINAEKTIKELDYKNNEKSIELTLNPTYAAQVSVDKSIYKQGESVIIKGSAIPISRNATLGQKEVEISITSNNFTRKEKVTTDPNGDFVYTFVPINNENGYFTVGAGYPGVSEKVQANFNILGFDWVDKVDYLKWDLVENEPQYKTLKLRNKTLETLSNIHLEIPSDYKIIVISEPITLAAGEEGILKYNLTAKKVSPLLEYETILFSIVSDEGASRSMQAFFYSSSQLAQLVTTPASINTTMVKGESRYYEFDLINRSAIEAKKVKINLPLGIEWMKLSSPKEIASIPANDTVKVILLLKPTDKEQLNVPISGSLGVSVENGQGLNIPFRFETVSTKTGKLSIDAIDEYTLNTLSAPHVGGAKVVVRHPFSGKIMAEGLTEKDGLFITDDLPAGFYTVTVSATKHDTYQNNIEVDPGRTKSVSAFIPYQAVSIDWNVKPTEIDDEYQVDIVVDFETNVPKPVVVMSLTEQVPELDPGDCFITNVLLVNHGLIQAQNIQINTPSRDGYTFELMTNLIEKLPAKASIYVPMKVCRIANGGSDSYSHFDSFGSSDLDGGFYSSGNKDCTITIVTGLYEFICDKNIGQWIVIQTGSIFDITFPCPDPIIFYPKHDPKPDPTPNNDNRPRPRPEDTYKPILITDIDCKTIKCLIDFFKTGYGCFEAFTGERTILSLKDAWDCGYGIGTFLYNCTPLGELIGDALDNILGYNISSRAYLKKVNQFEIFKEDFRQYMLFLEAMNQKVGILYKEFPSETEIEKFEKLNNNYIGSDKRMSDESILNIIKAFEGSVLTKEIITSYYNRWNKNIDGTAIDNFIDFNELNRVQEIIDNVNKYAESRGFKGTSDQSAVYYMADNITKTFLAAEELYNTQNYKSKKSVCATVTVKFSQKMTMTREAFEGTLTINNGNENKALSNIILDLEITDKEGKDCNHLFQINKDEFLQGKGSVNSKESKVGTVIFIPTKEAAPTVPKSYSFGGVFSYYDETIGERVTVTLHPVTLEVNPSPDLTLHYFMQRNILGDDPLTENVVEPSIPAELALLIENQGYGIAKNVKIESMQPEIIGNKLGLLIDFELIGSNFNNEPKQLGLNNINFGDIKPKSTALGQWWFTSSLLGHFVKYDIHITHLSSYGNKNLSLIKDAFVHELIHSVKAYDNGHDDINDFLVNDVPDLNDIPDAVYFSNGGKSDVNKGVGTTSNLISSSNLKTTLTINPREKGWNYGKINDPGGSVYKLVKVVREKDGKDLPLANFWQTHVTLLDGKDPLYEANLHFFDNISEITKYTLYYAPSDDILPDVVEFKNIENKSVTAKQVKTLEVVFNKEIDFDTFTTERISLTHQGNKLSTDDILIGRIDATRYLITLDKLTTLSGYYSLTVDCSNIKDKLGNTGNTGKAISWTQVISELAIFTFNANQVKAKPIETIEIVFNKDVNPQNVANNLFKLNTKHIKDMVIAPKENSKNTYILTGLKDYNKEDGNYELTVDLPKLEALDGTKGLVSQSFKWIVETKIPAVVSFICDYQGAVHKQNVTDVTIVLNKEVKDFNLGMISLNYEGTEIPTSNLTLFKIDDKTYLLSGLRPYTEGEGKYVLSIDQSSLVDLRGNLGEGVAVETWSVSFSKPAAVQKMKITPDRGDSNKDNYTSGDDLQINLDVIEDNRTVVVNVITPAGKNQLAELHVDKAGRVSIPIGTDYSGNLKFEAYVYNENGNKSNVVTIDAYIDVTEFNYTLDVEQTTCNEITSVVISFSVPVDAKELQHAAILRVGNTDIPMANMNISKINPTTYLLDDMANMLPGGVVSLGIDMSKIYKLESGLEGKGLRFDVLGYSDPRSLHIEGEKQAKIGTLTTYSTNADMSEYNWRVNGGDIITQRNTDVTILWTSKGKHSVLLESTKNTDCINSNAELSVEVLDDKTENHQLSINNIPNNGKFDLFYKNKGQNTVTISVNNMNGATVYQKANILMNDILHETIDIRPCSAGVYFVIVRNKGKKAVVKMIVK